jgi:tetratricopeptide (TPR) repeat protein
VAAADVRFEEWLRLNTVTERQRARLLQATSDAQRKTIAAEAEKSRAAIMDEAVARLAEEYEVGSVLAFFFADQLRDFQSSGFDVANFFTDMVSGLNVQKENNRIADTAGARERALAARKAHPRYSIWLIDPSAEMIETVDVSRSSSLIRSLTEVEKLLQTKNYEEAETRLKALLQENPGNVRLLFTLGQTAALWARDTTDDDLQTERLNRALANYRLAVAAASRENDGALISRAHVSMGRILAALDQKDEALKEFDTAIKLGDVPGGAYRDALEAKRRLTNP